MVTCQPRYNAFIKDDSAPTEERGELACYDPGFSRRVSGFLFDGSIVPVVIKV